jgi:hypothetical protein
MDVVQFVLGNVIKAIMWFIQEKATFSVIVEKEENARVLLGQKIQNKLSGVLG